jgi:hypothetical protein
MPRWSVWVQPAPLPGGIRSIAGLPGAIAMVGVGPPFPASGPSRGSARIPGQLVPGQVRLRC